MAYLEDAVVGRKVRFGSYEVKRDEVIDFATKFDPQPFHLSDEAAAKTYFGRIAASGWHTAAMMMRMIVDNMDPEGGSLGGIGLDELRWLKPVYPGDTLTCESEAIEVSPSRSKPDRGTVRTRLTIFNQNDEPVMTSVNIALFARRPA